MTQRSARARGKKRSEAEAPASAPPRDGKPTIRIPDEIPLIGSGSTVMYPQQLMPVLATEEREIKAVDDAAAA